MKPGVKLICCGLAVLLTISCSSDFVPKPRAYPRVHYPERTVTQQFGSDFCPFSFEIWDYYKIENKTTFFNETAENPCWGVNLNLEDLNGTMYLTYKELGEEQQLDRLAAEAYKLTFKHAEKADFIEPLEVRKEDSDAYGLIYHVGGDAASQLQFFVTDTVQHFLRGTLNFNATPNADSLAPVVAFVAEDLAYMLNSLEWQ